MAPVAASGASLHKELLSELVIMIIMSKANSSDHMIFYDAVDDIDENNKVDLSGGQIIVESIFPSSHH